MYKKNVTSITPPNGTYKITLEAYDTSAWLATTQAKHYSITWNSITVSAVNPPPVCAIPTGESVSNITSSTATLTWQAVQGAVKYRLALSNGQNNVTTSLSYTPSLQSSTSYSWQVKTICQTDSSLYSASQNFTTSPAPPPAVISLDSIKTYYNSAAVTIYFHNAAGTVYVQLIQASNSTANGSGFGKVNPPISPVDKSLSKNKTYWIRIQDFGLDAANNNYKIAESRRVQITTGQTKTWK